MATCAGAIEPPNDLKEGFSQSVIILLVIYITIGNIHPQKFMQTYTIMFA